MLRFFKFLSYFTFLAVISIFLFGPALNGMNDDSIIVWLTSGYDGTSATAITVYTSIFYGFILKFLYGVNQDLGWHGILQLALVVTGASILGQIGLKQVNLQQKKNFYFLMLVLSTFIVWFSPRPTFTVTSIFIGFLAFSIFLLSLNQPFNIKVFVIANFLLIFSYLLRPEASYLVISFGILNVVLYFYYANYFSRNQFLKLGLFILPILLLTLADSIAISTVKQQSKAWSNYLEFNEFNYKLDTNPAELVFYKKLESGEISNVDWTSVEAVLYQKNAFFDNKVFSNDILRIATESTSKSIGIAGAINSSFVPTLNRAWMFLSESIGFFVLIILLISLFFLAQIKPKIKLAFLITNFSFLALIFYYFSAVSRLPARIHVPLIFGLSILLLIVLLDVKYINKFLVNIISIATSVTLMGSLIFGQSGMLKISNTNKSYRADIEHTILKLNQLDNQGKFIGLLEAFSLEATLAYGRPQIKNDVDYLTSGWMAFSPPWYEKRNNLQLLKNNPYEAIAKQPGVYWISDPVTAEVLNMYMNDREIFRKNKCELLSLHSGLKVYTYQSEIACDN